ncbi:MAG: hypothetical protein JWQ22_714 [Devosia sp.]|nr:hypothetical protein [Devosia sp.]
MLPLSGSVLGVDVGWSLKQRSSGICRLTWTADTILWRIERCTYDETERRATIGRVLGGQAVLATAIDGPLGPNFEHILRYRAAERMLTRGLQRHIGKPGQTNSGNGIKLNQSASAFANDVLSLNSVGPAKHLEALHSSAIVEAFPTSFLGVMVGDPAVVPTISKQRSDRYYSYLAENGRLAALLDAYLPGRVLAQRFREVTNHDERAGLVCALTAMAIATGDYSAVGDNDGWIILPPLRFMAPWASSIIRANEEPGFTGRFVSWNQGRQLVL